MKILTMILFVFLLTGTQVFAGEFTCRIKAPVQDDKWDFSTALPDYLFNFEPSPGYRKIDIIETVQDKTSVQE